MNGILVPSSLAANSGGGNAPVTGGRLLKYVTQDDRLTCDTGGELFVVRKLAAKTRELGLSGGIPRQWARKERIDRRQSRSLLWFGEYDVEAYGARAVVAGQTGHETGEPVARPRPLTLGREAALVDVDDHDLAVDPARHREQQARVVGELLQPGQRRQARVASTMENEGDRQRHADEGSEDRATAQTRFLPRIASCSEGIEV
jgi:hypothetical protein